eukprot:7073976-Ditylum_brightwellii.AAC.1
MVLKHGIINVQLTGLGGDSIAQGSPLQKVGKKTKGNGSSPGIIHHHTHSPKVKVAMPTCSKAPSSIYGELDLLNHTIAVVPTAPLDDTTATVLWVFFI